MRARYGRRQNDAERYSLLKSAVLLAVQERQRALVDLFVSLGWNDLSVLRLLEVGCGTGSNLLELLRLGFKPGHLKGIELLESSAQQARSILPPSVAVVTGDAASVEVQFESDHDIVFQSTVFSSLPSEEFQKRLARRMWQWTRPGGGVLWYDFTVNNPSNPDVRGIPVRRIKGLFPEARFDVRRITLAPPIARAVTRVSPKLYSVFNAFPLLRTHVLVWAGKRQ